MGQNGIFAQTGFICSIYSFKNEPRLFAELSELLSFIFVLCVKTFSLKSNSTLKEVLFYRIQAVKSVVHFFQNFLILRYFNNAIGAGAVLLLFV